MANKYQGVESGLAELKTFFQGPMIDTLNEEIAIYRAAEKVKQGWSGEKVVRPLRVRRNQGIGATSDGGALPSIGRQGTVRAEISAKYNYLRFGITGPMIAASQSDKGSFVRSASYELEMGYKDLSNDISRQTSWDGTGTLAKLNAAAAGAASIVIKGRESTEPALKFVDVGMMVDILDGSTRAIKYSSVEVISTSGTAIASTATLVLNQNVTLAADDLIIRAGSKDMEIQGLLYGLDGATSTIYGVDRSLYQSYQGNVTDNSGAALTLDAMQAVYNEGLRRGGVGSYNASFCDFASLRMYQKLLTADKRYVNSVEGDGSFGKKGKFYLDFNGVPLVPDKDCPTRFFFLPQEVFKMYELKAMEFADESGSMYIPQSDTDALEVRIRHFVNLFNEQPAACAVLKNYVSP